MIEIAPSTKPTTRQASLLDGRGAPEPISLSFARSRAVVTPRMIRDVGPAGAEVRRGKQQDDRDDVHGAVDTGPERIESRVDDAEGELTDEERAVVEAARTAKSPKGGGGATRTGNTRKPGRRCIRSMSGRARRRSTAKCVRETFHRRMGEPAQLRTALEDDHQRQQANLAATSRRRRRTMRTTSGR